MHVWTDKRTHEIDPHFTGLCLLLGTLPIKPNTESNRPFNSRKLITLYFAGNIFLRPSIASTCCSEAHTAQYIPTTYCFNPFHRNASIDKDCVLPLPLPMTSLHPLLSHPDDRIPDSTIDMCKAFQLITMFSSKFS